MQHDYRSQLSWAGNTGDGYTAYSRDYRVSIAGRPDIMGSADAHFRGDPARHNPEDLFVVAISTCHLLSYLALCARAGIAVLAYEDDAHGVMVTAKDGSGRFEEVTLNPVVTIAAGNDEALALALHETAHEQCFIANSVKVPIHHHATIQVAETAAGQP